MKIMVASEVRCFLVGNIDQQYDDATYSNNCCCLFHVSDLSGVFELLYLLSYKGIVNCLD